MTAPMITTTFKTRNAAEDVLARLEGLGVTDENLSIIMSDDTRGKSFSIETGDKMAEMSATGATGAGLAGAVFGGLAAAGTLAIPGVNLVVAGPIVASLAGLGAGAAAGGFIGALVGVGIPEHEAKVFEGEIKQGNVLLAVKPENDDQREQIMDILERADAYNIAA